MILDPAKTEHAALPTSRAAAAQMSVEGSRVETQKSSRSASPARQAQERAPHSASGLGEGSGAGVHVCAPPIVTDTDRQGQRTTSEQEKTRPDTVRARPEDDRSKTDDLGEGQAGTARPQPARAAAKAWKRAFNEACGKSSHQGSPPARGEVASRRDAMELEVK